MFLRIYSAASVPVVICFACRVINQVGISTLLERSIPANVGESLARGADREGLLRVEAQVARLRAELPTRVVATVRDAQKRRAL